MHFISHETKTRHKNTEDKLTATREAVEDPAFRQALGDKYADAQLSVLDSFYVPNVVHGKITVPEVYKGDLSSMPAVSIFPREQLQMSPDIKAQHPLQEDSSVKHLAGITGDDIETTRSLLKASLAEDATHRMDDDTIGLRKNTSAGLVVPVGRTHVDTRGAEKDKGYAKLWVQRRPILLLPIVNRYYNPLTGVHEIEHGLQSFRDPIVRLDGRESSDEELRRELEAYTVQALAAAGLYLNSTNDKFQSLKFMQHNDGAYTIASETAKMNDGKTDPYEVSPALRQHLSDKVFSRTGKSLYLN